MTTPVLVRNIKIREGDPAVLMARVQDETGANVQQADVSSISYELFNLKSDTPRTAVTTGSLTVANVIFDTLQTDSIWDEDTTGYNFKNQFTAANFTLSANGNGRYWMEIRASPTSGENYWVGIWDITIVDALTSL